MMKRNFVKEMLIVITFIIFFSLNVVKVIAVDNNLDIDDDIVDFDIDDTVDIQDLMVISYLHKLFC